MTYRDITLAVALALLTTFVVHGQAPAQSAASANQPPAYQQHVARATAAASGVARNVLNQCNIPDAATGRGGRGGQAAGARGGPAGGTETLEAGKAFDNLYFVGLASVSSWAIKTSDGIILIDALNNGKEAESAIVPGLRKVGLDPAQVKYLIVTHSHGDHYGGARYLVDHLHPRVISSEADWKGMAGPLQFNNPAWDAPPARDMTIVDGQKLTLGDTTITLYVTPGHTPGTISVVIPVKDNGTPHTAALWGGTGFNFTPIAAAFKTYGDSADRFKEITRGADVDIFLSNHGFVDETPTKLPALRTRKPGEPNPYVIGREAVQNVLTVLSECAKAREVVAAAN